MHVSRESAEQTARRLLQVIARSEFEVFDSAYAFEEMALGDFQTTGKPEALAFVRDEEVWSQLVPAEDSGRELFRVFRFHFAEGLDNSGFVGWLASHLKQKLGTGVFVVCGQNSKRGGIFDYWGCPLEVADDVLEEVRNLIKQGSAAQQ